MVVIQCSDHRAVVLTLQENELQILEFKLLGGFVPIWDFENTTKKARFLPYHWDLLMKEMFKMSSKWRVFLQKQESAAYRRVKQGFVA